MRDSLPTLKSLLFLSILLGISILFTKIVLIMQIQDVSVKNYSTFLKTIPNKIPTDALQLIHNKEKNLEVSIDRFNQEHQEKYTPTYDSNTQPSNTPTPQTPPTSITPTTTPTPTPTATP